MQKVYGINLIYVDMYYLNETQKEFCFSYRFSPGNIFFSDSKILEEVEKVILRVA